MIAAEAVAKAPADGYTMLMASPGEIAYASAGAGSSACVIWTITRR